ncbi:MAG: histidine phosphatase family protein [Gammaproteobacteria bacterium]|nr:histidine phosphatase family protein [Gammaproteobacteria bacterium]
MVSDIKLDLLRHGETTAGSCFIGSTDVELSQPGWEQMKQAVAGKPGYDVVITSPMLRCLEFSKYFALQNNIDCITSDAMREMTFGTWEAKNSQQIWEEDSRRLSLFWDDPVNNPPPEGDNLTEFYNRVVHGFEGILADYKDQSVLVVAHGGSIKSIIAWALGLDLKQLNRINISHGTKISMHVHYDGCKYFPVINL